MKSSALFCPIFCLLTDEIWSALSRIWSENKLLDKLNSVMSGNLNLYNNKITHLANPMDSTDGVNKNYVDTNIATKANLSLVQNVMRQVTYKSDKAELNNYMKLDGTNSMTGNMNLGNNKITNLTNPTDSTDGVNLRTLNNHITKPSDHTNRFAYLMDPTPNVFQEKTEGSFKKKAFNSASGEKNCELQRIEVETKRDR